MESATHEVGLSEQDKQTARKNGYVVKADQPFWWQQRKLQVTVNGWYYCCAFALSSAMAGQVAGYNVGYIVGIGGFTLIVFLTAIAYILLAASLSELASAIPFCGGSYGYTRFVFGKLPGYLIGIIESLEYFVFITSSAYYAASSFVIFSGAEDKYLLLFSFVVCLGIWALQMQGGKLMWNAFGLLCIINILTVIIFFLATTKWMDMKKNAPIPGNQPWFVSDPSIFFQAFPYAIFFFVGVEIIPMISEEVEEPQKSVPTGLRRSIWILLFLSILTVYGVAALPPPYDGTLLDTAFAFFPSEQGWSLVFGSNSPAIGLLFFFPMFNCGFVTSIGSNRQLFAMSRSGYLPAVLSLTNEKGIPYVPTTLGMILCFIINLSNYYCADPVRFTYGLLNIAAICGLSNYIVQLSCFVVWRYKFEAIQREYRSPYGIAGAIVGILFFALALISLLAYTPHITDAIIPILIFLFLGVIYYLSYARFHLTLSPEEVHALFPVYSFMVLQGKWKKKSQVEKERLPATTHHSSNSQMKPQLVELEPVDLSHRAQSVDGSEQRRLFNPFVLDQSNARDEHDQEVTQVSTPEPEESRNEPLELSTPRKDHLTPLREVPETTPLSADTDRAIVREETPLSHDSV